MIRSLKPHELEVYLPLRQALWPGADDPSEVMAQLAHPERFQILVAEEEGRLVGWAEVSLRDYAEGCETSPVGFLEGWYVAPTHRRRGIGRRLVEAAEDWARAKGCIEMASDTELHNTSSQLAHTRLGYQEVERLVCFRKSL
ncbi:aminoglycoside 6'-N-acetyltransferase [Meiothermus sp.]|uniref:aminoglycoside 6'-N-acetyltransferase n=1 Tax=Meiothermus sp. TaxID=1955249 RepID=UPI0021DE6D18|nr:aminoglycoside 6'-N-acetyltransferase [Meiothermus sp.]GIW25926.1 MAG: aminoglycoside N(6')-acetyltransferase type 1 [Meiothermus sp.]